MGFANSKIEAIMLVSAASMICFSFFYGLATRPIIAYSVSTPLDYNGTIDFESGDLLVYLETMNEGLSPARVVLTVWLYNMSLIEPKEIEKIVGDGFIELRIPLDEPVKEAESNTYMISLSPSDEHTYLFLVFTAESKPQFDPINGYFNSFAAFEAERPNALLLKHLGGARYMRVRRKY